MVVRPTCVNPLVVALVHTGVLFLEARVRHNLGIKQRLSYLHESQRLSAVKDASVGWGCFLRIGGKATPFWRLESSPVPLADCWEKPSLPVFSDLRPNLPEKIHLLPYHLFSSANTTIIATLPITTTRTIGRARWVLQHTKSRPLL